MNGIQMLNKGIISRTTKFPVKTLALIFGDYAIFAL